MLSNEVKPVITVIQDLAGICGAKGLIKTDTDPKRKLPIAAKKAAKILKALPIFVAGYGSILVSNLGRDRESAVPSSPRRY